MIVGYRRVSTTDQNLDRQSLEGCERVFEEKASGANRDRPQLAELIAFVRAGDTVVVHSLDRLGRDMRDLCNIVAELRAKGVTVEFRSERLTFSADAADPLAELQFNMMAAFAQFERRMIRKRQAEGIEKAKAAGVYKGRKPSVPVDDVRKLRAEGLGASEIAKRLGIGRASVYRALDPAQAAGA